MSDPTQPIDYRPGDEANGHVLSASGAWVPIHPMPAPEPVPVKAKLPLKRLIIGGVVGMVLFTSCGYAMGGGAPEVQAVAAPTVTVTKTVTVGPSVKASTKPTTKAAPTPTSEPVTKGVVAWGQRFDAGDGNWISVSKPRYKAGLLDKPITVVDITLHNGSDQVVEVGSFSLVAEANYGANGKTAPWSVLDTTPIDGAAQANRSVTGEYAFNGHLSNPITIQVEAWGSTAYFG